MERTGGFDKEAFDTLLKQLLETKEAPPAEPSEGESASASKTQGKDGTSPATSEPPPPPVQEREGALVTPSTLPTAPVPEGHEWPGERTAPTKEGAAPPEMEALKKRLADLEATQGRLQEQLQRSTEQLAAATQQKESAPPAAEAPSAAVTGPGPLDEPEVMDRPVAVERAMVKVPSAGELSRPGGQGFLERLLSLLHRLFPSFVPAQNTASPPDNPDALYTGRIELVIPAEDAWGRLERILTGLAGLRGVQVHGLYSGSRGEHTVSLEMDVPASLKDIQDAVPELKEIRTLSSHKGVTRLAVKIT